MTNESSRQHHKRRKYLLDPQWQLSVFRNIAAVALVAASVQLALTLVVSNTAALDRWSGQATGLLAFGTNALFLVLVFVALWIVLVRMTHAVVGPAMVIKRAVDALVEGRFDSRLSLREKDYLKDLAGSVKHLSDHLKKRDETARELQAALRDGNHDRAMKLADRLCGQQHWPTEIEQECVS